MQHETNDWLWDGVCGDYVDKICVLFVECLVTTMASVVRAARSKCELAAKRRRPAAEFRVAR